MPPKFQSSFIPKGPLAAPSSVPMMGASKVRRLSFFSFVARLVFALSIVLALGVVGYKWYLNYSIGNMGAELEAMRQELATGVVGELVSLNDRIVSTEKLIEGHRVISPLMRFLETTTPKAVRFTEFVYRLGEKGPELLLKGEAQSYAALALEADAIHQNADLKEPTFSDIRLDEKGNVTFSLTALVSPDLLSYERWVSRTPASAVPAATSTVRAATSSAATTTRSGGGTTTAATSSPRN